MRSRVGMLLAAAVLSAGLVAAGETIAWRGPDWEAASREAKATGRLVFVYVTDTSFACPWCAFFEQKYGGDPAYVAWSNGLFVNVKVDIAAVPGMAFVERLGLQESGVPLFFILDANGRVLSRRAGVVQDVPFMALTMLWGQQRTAMPFARDTLIGLANRLRALKESARGDKTAVYAAMEALAWFWAGSVKNARASFGRGWAEGDHLGTAQHKEWYVHFWAEWAGDNFPAVLAVAEQAFHKGEGAIFARYAAIIHARANDYPAAVQLGEAYLRENPDDAAFARAVQEWRMR